MTRQLLTISTSYKYCLRKIIIQINLSSTDLNRLENWNVFFVIWFSCAFLSIIVLFNFARLIWVESSHVSFAIVTRYWHNVSSFLKISHFLSERRKLIMIHRLSEIALTNCVFSNIEIWIWEFRDRFLIDCDDRLWWNIYCWIKFEVSTRKFCIRWNHVAIKLWFDHSQIVTWLNENQREKKVNFNKFEKFYNIMHHSRDDVFSRNIVMKRDRMFRISIYSIIFVKHWSLQEKSSKMLEV